MQPQKAFYRIKITILSIGLISSFCSYASDEQGPSKAPDTAQITLKAKKSHEECVLLKARQSLSYEYQSSAELKFNFHYHDRTNGKTVYVTGPELLTSFKSEDFTYPKNQVVCLMWVNKSATDVSLNYEHQIKQ